jgi:hypothetical protein
MNELEIRDNRNKEWFWLDNEYLNGYAKFLGASCTVVYISLCRHANNATQTCFPSMQLIAEENGISRRTVITAIEKLEEWGIISIFKTKKADGTQNNNVYTLLAKSMWKSKPSATIAHGNRVQPLHIPSANNDQSRVQPLHNNKTHINKTNITSVVETTQDIFSLEEEIKKMGENPRTDIKIIGLYIKSKKLKITTKKELSEVIKQNLKVAGSLSSFQGKIGQAIKDEMNKANQQITEKGRVDYDWKLSTILKRLT